MAVGILGDVSELLTWAAMAFSLVPGGQPVGEFLGIMSQIAQLVASIVDIIRNDDDLVKERTIFWDQAALATLWAQPEHMAFYEFDGGSQGYHRLYLQET